jgi:transposase InsO family protein
VEESIVEARRQAPFMGCERLLEHYPSIAAGRAAVRRVLSQRGLTRRRKKKYETKRDLRAVKAGYSPFAQPQVDAKYLTDIPYYVEQLQRNPRLPRFEYTYRDPKTGGVFLGFSNELSESHACCFMAAVGGHLRRHGFDPAGYATIQTDNGSEFSGAERKTRSDRGFTHVVEDILRARHRFIPPGKKNHQADVETFHNIIEVELFNLETFASRNDFFEKGTLWQWWANTTRKNASKGRRTPDDILLEACPARDSRIWLLPALDLDALLDRRIQYSCKNKNLGGYHVPALLEKSKNIVLPESWTVE